MKNLISATIVREDSSNKVMSSNIVVYIPVKGRTNAQNVDELSFRYHRVSHEIESLNYRFEFFQLSNLQQHMGNHAKDPQKTKQFQSQNCQICGKGFATEASLNLHLEKQHREMIPDERISLVRQPKPKVFVCVICSKSYTTESALAIHSVKVKNIFFFQKIISPLCPITTQLMFAVKFVIKFFHF